MGGAMPHLKDFAASAVTFTRAYSQSPICTVSRTSFLTGRRPDRFGLSSTPSFRDVPSSAKWSSLPGYFKANNYTVLGLGKTWHAGSPRSWDGDRSWSTPVLPSSSTISNDHRRDQILLGDLVAAALEYEYWPPDGSYTAVTTDSAWTAQCAGAAPFNAGRDPLTGQRLAGSIGNPSCWADTTPLSSSIFANQSKPENDNGEDDDDDEDLLFYDGQLAERAVDLLGKLMATSTINVVDDKDRDGGDGSSSTTVEKEEVSAPPWYLAVGFHLPHTPWVVPRRDWEANQKHARQRSSSSADTKMDTKNQQHASDDEKVGLDLMTPAQTLPPIGMPPLAGCAGKGCLPSISFVNTTYQPSPPSTTTTTTSSSSSEVVRLESPRDFDPWRPLDDPTQAFLRGRCVGCESL